jgi:hypothetical protein
MLLMKRQFFDAIRAGRKTTTLRYWSRRMVRPGSRYAIRGLGSVRIDDVQSIDAAALTDAHALADGFDGADDLLAELDRLYPSDTRSGKELYLVSFTFLGPPDPQAPSS